MAHLFQTDSVNHVLRRQQSTGTMPPSSMTSQATSLPGASPLPIPFAPGGLLPAGMILPAMPPPPGVVSDFVHPQSSARPVVVCSIVFTILAGIFVLLRMYTRCLINHSVGSDDLVKYGLGLHMWNVPLTTFSPHFLRHLTATILVQTLLPTFAKLSILLLYLQVFSANKMTKWAIRATITFICLYTIILVFITIFICSPVAKAWDITITQGKCLNPAGLGISGGALNAVADLMVLLIPLPVIVRLKVATRQKIGTLAVILTGGFATAVSIVRLKVYVHDTYNNFDITWSDVATLQWCIIEANVSIMCACALTLKPFLCRFFPKILELTTGRTKSSAGLSNGSRTVRKSWRASKPGETKRWSSQINDPIRDGTYLELGEGGINETVIHPQLDVDKGQPEALEELSIESMTTVAYVTEFSSMASGSDGQREFGSPLTIKAARTLSPIRINTDHLSEPSHLTSFSPESLNSNALQANHIPDSTMSSKRSLSPASDGVRLGKRINDSKDRSNQEATTTSTAAADSPSRSIGLHSSEDDDHQESEEEGIITTNDDDDDDHNNNPPLPDEPAPIEPPDDGWQPVWEETAQAFYFYNQYTGETTWTNPRVPEAAAATTTTTTTGTAPGIGNHDRIPPVDVDAEENPTTTNTNTNDSSRTRNRPHGGYDPSIHGDYDPTAPYAQEGAAEDPDDETAAAAGKNALLLLDPATADMYAATGTFNRFTGKWQASGLTPDNFNDENKSRRQMGAFFDVDAAANRHDGKSLKAERAGKKLSKKEVKAFKEKRREKKEEKRRAWLRD
ncbi:MAG: hypothetical protein M1816_003692 [Peltula sp. TS41687]|nr:MAG: hypothetical protein M1816_003692 [Peltula sp. TS41687]